MNIEIDSTRKLEDVQKDFNRAFPYLKLDFVVKNKTSNNQHAKQALTVGDLNATIAACVIEITEQMTVSDLEKIFSGTFGLPVRILRKSGNVWMETSITNSWTLGQQNVHAKEISGTRIF